jgi:hypothetical protein
MTTADCLNQLITEARAAQEKASTCRKALESVLFGELRRLVPEGSTIDLRDRKLPDHLASLRVTNGASRGTHVFRITKVGNVHFDSATPMLSKWTCEAVPISETTGQDMSATTANVRGAKQRATVLMQGHICREYDPDEKMSDELSRLIKNMTGDPYVLTVPHSEKAPAVRNRTPR